MSARRPEAREALRSDLERFLRSADNNEDLLGRGYVQVGATWLRKALALLDAERPDAAGSHVRIPTDEDEAALMVLLGTDYLRQHAPQRLREADTPGGEREPVQACPVCHGRGMVPLGFYADVYAASSTAVSPRETCRTCQGTTVYPPALRPAAGREPPEPDGRAGVSSATEIH